MPDRAVHLSVVVPVRDGAGRLPENLRSLDDFLCRQAFPCELVLVDDASGPEAARVLAEFAGRGGGAGGGVTLLRNETNRGKGYSVARGMLAARGAHRVFTDADLAYPAPEIAKILRALETGADVAIACRVLPESRYLMSPSFFHYLYTRHVMSRVFNRVVRMLLLPGVLDTQAGLKGFTAAASEIVFRRLTVGGFGFDVEALYVARKHRLRVTQVAVDFRYDEEPSTVRFVADAGGMLRDLARIRTNDWRGRYD